MLKSLSAIELLEKKLSMPPYQRGYAWPSELIEELLRDAYKGFEEGKKLFLGTVILTSDGMVVDGQQRLTTLFVMIKTLLQEVGLPEDETDLDDYQRAAGLIGIDYPVNPSFKDFCSKYLGENALDIPRQAGLSEKNVVVVRNAISKFVAKRQIDTLAFLVYLSNEVWMGVYETDTVESAIEVFLSVNRTSLPLGNPAQIKAITFAEIPTGEQVEAARLWGRVEAQAGDKFENFLGVIRGLKHFDKTRKSLLVEYEKKVLPDVASRKAFPKTLARLWDVHQYVVDPIRPWAKHLQLMKQFGGNVEYILPMLQFNLKNPEDSAGMSVLVENWERVQRKLILSRIGVSTKRLVGYKAVERMLVEPELTEFDWLEDLTDESLNDLVWHVDATLKDKGVSRTALGKYLCLALELDAGATPDMAVAMWFDVIDPGVDGILGNMICGQGKKAKPKDLSWISRKLVLEQGCRSFPLSASMMEEDGIPEVGGRNEELWGALTE